MAADDDVERNALIQMHVRHIIAEARKSDPELE